MNENTSQSEEDYRIDKLKKVVKRYHYGQVRKYTNEPYFNHLLSVSEIVKNVTKQTVIIASALCHDLFEDTKCDYHTLLNELLYCDFSEIEAKEICLIVTELTDQFTKDAYPTLNRKARKKLECERLSKISEDAQTVKYADMIDNTTSIVENDENFAKVYLSEKKDILSLMTLGNKRLYEFTFSQLHNIPHKPS